MKNKKESVSQKTFLMPLNKYLSNAGICSRRKAVEYIQEGLVKVNGKVVKIPQRRVAEDDNVTFKDKPIIHDKKIYILLSKPKDYVTTLSDQQGRKTVMDLVKGATKKRIYPVGRLDRATTGLLLLTNDGQLTQKLAHPKYEVKKMYSVVLDRPIKIDDLKAIHTGVKLKDGTTNVDSIHYVPGKRKNHVKLQLHSGKNRIVRRIFEHFGYKVLKLDRFNYAGLTKRGVKIGTWRLLTGQEISSLQKGGQVDPPQKMQRKQSGRKTTGKRSSTKKSRTTRRKK